MSLSSTTKPLVLLATSSLLVGVVVVVASSLFNGSSSRGATEFDDIEGGEDDVITEDLVAKIFDRLFLEMQAVVAQLYQQLQRVQRMGERITEAQMKHFLLSGYEQALLEREAKIYEDYGVDEDCLEEATWQFMNEEDKYPKAKKAVERFQKLYEKISGDSVVGRRPGKEATGDRELLSADDTIKAAEVYFGSLTKKMTEIVEELKAEGKNLQDRSVVVEFQLKFQSVATDVGEAALGSIGTTQSIFEASIRKHGEDPRVTRSMMILQMQQRRELQLLGLAA